MLLLLMVFPSDVLIRIQVHNPDALPVARGATPALGMALPWRDEDDSAVTMLVVVPLDESADPLSGGKQSLQMLAADTWGDTLTF